MLRLLIILTSFFSVCFWTISISFFTGVLCQSFTPHTGEICPGDDVTFTCSAGPATFWTVGPRDEDECAYRSGDPTTQMCGPGDRFTSGPTDINVDISSSFLIVDSITVDLNGTLVECDNAGGNLIGSGSICIVGEDNFTLTT